MQQERKNQELEDFIKSVECAVKTYGFEQVVPVMRTHLEERVTHLRPAIIDLCDSDSDNDSDSEDDTPIKDIARKRPRDLESENLNNNNLIREQQPQQQEPVQPPQQPEPVQPQQPRQLPEPPQPEPPQQQQQQVPRTGVLFAYMKEPTDDNKDNEKTKDLKKRIRSMLERATHPSANPTEARTAMKLARKLMQEHRLEMTDVMEADSNSTSVALAAQVQIRRGAPHGDYTLPKKLDRWPRRLASIVCHFTGMIDSRTKRASWVKQKTTFTFLGQKTDSSLSALMFSLLFNQIVHLSNSNTGVPRLSYIDGLLDALYHQAEVSRKETPDAQALALSHDRAADQAKAQCGITRVKTTSFKPRKNTDSNARAMGKEHGNKRLRIDVASKTLE